MECTHVSIESCRPCVAWASSRDLPLPPPRPLQRSSRRQDRCERLRDAKPAIDVDVEHLGDTVEATGQPGLRHRGAGVVDNDIHVGRDFRQIRDCLKPIGTMANFSMSYNSSPVTSSRLRRRSPEASMKGMPDRCTLDPGAWLAITMRALDDGRSTGAAHAAAGCRRDFRRRCGRPEPSLQTCPVPRSSGGTRPAGDRLMPAQHIGVFIRHLDARRIHEVDRDQAGDIGN